MSELDRKRWDDRYRTQGPPEPLRQHWLTKVVALPRAGAALDVASGSGALSLWLAAQGLDVLAVDVSPEALRLAEEAARSHGLPLSTRCLDLERDALPEGPFALITCARYLQRSLIPELAGRLAPGGLLVLEIATVTNLERHHHPSRRFLLEPGELARLLDGVEGLQTLHASEGWCAGSHMARASARRS